MVIDPIVRPHHLSLSIDRDDKIKLALVWQLAIDRPYNLFYLWIQEEQVGS